MTWEKSPGTRFSDIPYDCTCEWAYSPESGLWHLFRHDSVNGHRMFCPFHPAEKEQ